MEAKMAAVVAVIGTCNYTYGASDQPNRQIQFSRTGLGAGTIQAQAFVLNAGIVGNYISTIPGGQISVEMESTSTKANALALGRALNPSQFLSTLTLPQQNAVIGALGTRRIEVTNDVGGLGGLELVTSINIFDPR